MTLDMSLLCDAFTEKTNLSDEGRWIFIHTLLKPKQTKGQMGISV